MERDERVVEVVETSDLQPPFADVVNGLLGRHKIAESHASFAMALQSTR
jgi:hypothetical protein